MTSLAQVYMLLCIFLLPHEETHLLWYAEKAIILLYTRTSWIKHWRVGLSGNRQYWACAAHQGDSYRNRLSAPSLYSYPVARAVCLLFISLADHLAARLRYSSLITPIRICEAQVFDYVVTYRLTYLPLTRPPVRPLGQKLTSLSSSLRLLLLTSLH